MDREQIARKLFEGIPDALVVADRKGIIRVWNGGAERIFGFSEGEALGQSLDIITPERLRERHWNGYEATMQQSHVRPDLRRQTALGVDRDRHLELGRFCHKLLGRRDFTVVGVEITPFPRTLTQAGARLAAVV